MSDKINITEVLNRVSVATPGPQGPGGGGDLSDAVILAPLTSVRNVISSASGVVPLTVRGGSAASTTLLVQNSAGTTVARITADGTLFSEAATVGAVTLHYELNRSTTILAANGGSGLTSLTLPSDGVTSSGSVMAFTTAGIGTWVVPCLNADFRLSNARIPTAHNQAWSTITGTPTSGVGYGITQLAWSTITGTPTSGVGYGITQLAWSTITGTPDSILGYGITQLVVPAPTAGNAGPGELVLVGDQLAFRDSAEYLRTVMVGEDNLASLASSTVSRDNLGVGYGTNGSTVCVGNDSRLSVARVAVLVAGSVVVSTAAVTANTRVMLTSNIPGGTPGWLRVSARTAGVSFTITSSSGSDTSTVAYQMFEP